MIIFGRHNHSQSVSKVDENLIRMDKERTTWLQHDSKALPFNHLLFRPGLAAFGGLKPQLCTSKGPKRIKHEKKCMKMLHSKIDLFTLCLLRQKKQSHHRLQTAVQAVTGHVKENATPKYPMALKQRSMWEYVGVDAPKNLNPDGIWSGSGQNENLLHSNVRQWDWACADGPQSWWWFNGPKVTMMERRLATLWLQERHNC